MESHNYNFCKELMNKLRIIKQDKIYDIDEIMKIDAPFEVNYKGVTLFKINNKENLVFFKRHIGVLNSSFHIVLYCIGTKDKQYFYHKETDTLFNSEEKATEFIKGLYQIYRRVIKCLQ